ncbi:DUF3291 domain-containing protein [Flavobacterium pectinovorum]|uniref:DUF3291 domain-containing protein n=1 Tax=Flavobacterium pectinovorum TaxID=29533 RepID=A0A502EAZ2_9FLAO|nr:DUF3291 domain-containing protein [Flavobacterium pectinovorum]TPG34102.1 DUF3291 domain-containing protein [Flavobacterium pectinovorum]
MSNYHLAEINIAKMKGVDINDPIMKEFVDNLDLINTLAEKSEGFVWRLKDDSYNATNLNPYNDEQIIVNVSVWEDIETLEHYMYKTFHSDFLKRRKEWFLKFGKAATAMWWIPKGHIPTLEEAVEKLDYLQQNGPSHLVFDFKNKFSAPEFKDVSAIE